MWRGREPRPATLSRIADALGVSYMDLVRVRAGEDPEPPAAPDLVTAITAQTVAIDRLVDRLDRLIPSETFSADEAWAAVARVLRGRVPAEAAQTQAELEREKARRTSRSSPRRSGHGEDGA
jgi:hypothetical protein